MIEQERIDRLGETIMQTSEGKFTSSFKIQSETDHNVWYNLSWNKYETNPHKAFRCECVSWQMNSNKSGSCKHVAALSKKLHEEGLIEKDWYQKLARAIPA